MTREETDSELIAQAKEERDTFGLLYERYVKKIYNYIYYRVGNHDDAEDLTGRTFFRALRKFDDYVDRGAPFSAWLYRIAHNLVANFHRDRSRRKEVPLEATQPAQIKTNSVEFGAVANEERKELLQAIRRLHPDRQKLLILKFIERLPNAEIGQIMGRSEGAIKSLYHRTLVALRQDLIPSNEEDCRSSPRWRAKEEHSMSGKMDDQTITDLLDAHAKEIQSGLSGPSALPAAPEADLEVLRPLMHLAERIAQVLIPVEPSPVFIASLELELGRAIHRPQPSLFTRYRKTILVSLAALGSALSVTSVILFYFLRLRTVTHTSQAS